MAPESPDLYEAMDLAGYRDDAALWRSVPMELVRRFRFVPLREDGERLEVALAAPVVEDEVDRLEMLLRRPLVVRVGDRSRIAEIIERNTNSSFLLDRASEDLRIELLGRDDGGGGAPLISLDAGQGAGGQPGGPARGLAAGERHRAARHRHPHRDQGHPRRPQVPG